MNVGGILKPYIIGIKSQIKHSNTQAPALMAPSARLIPSTSGSVSPSPKLYYSMNMDPSYLRSGHQVCPTSVNPVPSPRPAQSRVVVASGWTMNSSANCGSSSWAMGTVTSLLITETVREGTWARGTSEPSLCKGQELARIDEKELTKRAKTEEIRSAASARVKERTENFTPWMRSKGG